MEKLVIVNVKVGDLRPAEYNPRHWTKKATDDLKESIRKFGLVDPLIINSAENRKNIVIGGHFRLHIAKELGIEEVPVVYVNLPDIKKEMELNLRLNKNVGEFDWDLLVNLDDELLKNAGFEEQEIEKIVLGDFEDEIIDFGMPFGTINSWVRIGDFTAEINDEKYQKIKKMVEKEGNLNNLINKILEKYGELN